MTLSRVIEVYFGLTRIEDQFEIMKGVLDSRPLRVRTSKHIETHLLTCMIALIVVRIIQNKIVEYKGRSKDKNWENGLLAENGVLNYYLMIYIDLIILMTKILGLSWMHFELKYLRDYFDQEN